MEPHLKRLIPKLYRYQYDPSQRVRERMSRLWNTLVRDPQKAVTKHLDRIIEELLGCMVSDKWREREGATLGLVDAIQSRTFSDVRMGVSWGPCSSS